ncbi:hypothetical protein OBBRIDRAFT_262807 [Obba rivulosa]|uniref:Uncharacterized protein n=1 Tax=Obba rivulosa TaxID=1052685 RepID=A0A8E2AQD9_9APHY|nr:hypothetical protein OBBRIDRAFT_262807 [Obba rivulosa]
MALTLMNLLAQSDEGRSIALVHVSSTTPRPVAPRRDRSQTVPARARQRLPGVKHERGLQFLSHRSWVCLCGYHAAEHRCRLMWIMPKRKEPDYTCTLANGMNFRMRRGVRTSVVARQVLREAPVPLLVTYRPLLSSPPDSCVRGIMDAPSDRRQVSKQRRQRKTATTINGSRL